MDPSESNLSADSTKTELLAYLDDHFRPLQCSDPKHKYQFMEICRQIHDQSNGSTHQIYQLLCYSCKLKNSYKCAEEKHPTIELIESLRRLIEQTDPITLKLVQNKRLERLGLKDTDELMKQVISRIKNYVSHLKHTKVMLEEQITRLETEQQNMENHLEMKNNTTRQRLKEFKELLVQILKQNNSQYFQQHISSLKNYTEIDESGQLSVCLESEITGDATFWSKYCEKLDQINKSVNEWVTKIPNTSVQMGEDFNQYQNEVLAAHSFLLNEQQIKQELRPLLIDIDQFNQRVFEMKAILKSDLHKSYYQISTIDKCVDILLKMSSNTYYSKETVGLAKFLLGFCQFQGIGCQKNQNNAFKNFMESDLCMKQKNGYGVAQNWIGFCYERGEGVEKNCVEAVKYYKMAEEQGLAAASYNLGLCYEKGTGVQINLDEAKKHYKKAADQGFQLAIDSLKNI